RYATNPRFRLIEGDALNGKHALNETLAELIAARRASGAAEGLKLVANLPYNIASPLVVDLLLAGVEMLVFVVQKEVADRLAADAGSDDWGPLSAVVQWLGRVESLRTIPPQVFWSPPKVDSALVRVDRIDGRDEAEARRFSLFVQKLFMARRKTLRRAMQQGGYDTSVIAELGLDEK